MKRCVAGLAVVLAALACATPALATTKGSTEPTLEARAILPADASAPAPFPGAPDSEPAPQPGARQPVGGFSALIDAEGRDRYWAMPDNGFGSKANSRSFLLRLYEVEADWETAHGGDGEVEIKRWITLSDPHRRVPFPIVNETTRDRLLTGGDFDVESVRVDSHGDLWFGEEFGPYLLHTDRHGRVKEAPIPLPGVRSPDSAEPGTANLARSNGFEGIAVAEDGRTLYPVLEGPVAGDDPHVRRVYEYDLVKRRYERGWREYRVAQPADLVSDFTLAADGDGFVSLERDNAQGVAARHKQAFDVTLGRRGEVTKRRIADLLDLRDPHEISLPGRAGDVGLGDPFAMPYQTIEAVLPVGKDRLAIVNDTNFGSRGRNPDLPDYSDFVVIATPRPSRDTRTLATIGDTPYGDAQEAAFPRLVAAVNDDGAVSRVVHLGDIKNGSSTCDDERLQRLRDLFGTFDDPFLYTPGDNEWTDCHRAAAGGYVPTERLARLRRLLFPETEGPGEGAAGAVRGEPGNAENLTRLDEVSGGRMLFVRTLGERLAASGRKLVAIGSGSSGGTLLLNPRAPRGAGVMINAGDVSPVRPFTYPASVGDEILARFGPPPTTTEPDASAKVDYAERVLREYVLTDLKPDVVLNWFTEPDGSQHEHAVGSPEALATIRNDDRQIGLILDRLKQRNLHRRTNLFVISDHGFSWHTFNVNLEQELIAAGLKAGPGSPDVVVANSGTSLVHVQDRDPAKTQAIVEFLQRQPWVGALYTAANRPRDGRYVRGHGQRLPTEGWVDGTFSLELIHHANPERGADIVVTYPWANDRNPFGIPGTSGNAGGGSTGPLTGLGSGHGSISPWDIRNTFLAWGADIKDGVALRKAPAGNVDIAPTLLALEGLDSRSPDGRVLSEAFNRGPSEHRMDIRTRTLTTRDGDFRAAVQISEVDSRRYRYVDLSRRLP